MKIIGVVGGIASGKSTVSRYLSCIGACLIEVDKITHEVLELPEIKDQLRVRFVKYGFVNAPERKPEDNRKEIGKIIIENEQEFQWLERLTFPLVDEFLKRSISRYSKEMPALVLDCPLLFETGWNKLCDLVVFVDTDEETRKERYIERSLRVSSILNPPKLTDLVQKWTALEARQISLQSKKDAADFVVDCNTGYYQQYTTQFWETFVLGRPSQVQEHNV